MALRGVSVSPARVAGRCAARYVAAQPSWLAGLYGLGRNLSGARIAVRRIPWPFAGVGALLLRSVGGPAVAAVRVGGVPGLVLATLTRSWQVGLE